MNKHCQISGGKLRDKVDKEKGRKDRRLYIIGKKEEVSVV